MKKKTNTIAKKAMYMSQGLVDGSAHGSAHGSGGDVGGAGAGKGGEEKFVVNGMGRREIAIKKMRIREVSLCWCLVAIQNCN